MFFIIFVVYCFEYVGLDVWNNPDVIRLLSKSEKHQSISRVGAHNFARSQIRIVTNDSIIHDRLNYSIQKHGVRIQKSDIVDAIYEGGELSLYGEVILPEVTDCFNLHEEPFEDWSYIDDTTGEKLDHKKALKARLDEMARFRQMKVYKKVKREVALKSQAGKLVGVRWVDVAKGGC